MRTDIEDDGTNYIIDVELPGYKKENVRAELKDGYLTISRRGVRLFRRQ